MRNKFCLRCGRRKETCLCQEGFKKLKSYKEAKGTELTDLEKIRLGMKKK